MKGPVEERKPVTHRRRPDGIVEKRSDRLVRAVAFKQEDDLSLGQEDGVSVQVGLELLHTESRAFGEKRLRLPTTVGCEASNKDEAIHDGNPTPPATDMKIAPRRCLTVPQARLRRPAFRLARSELGEGVPARNDDMRTAKVGFSLVAESWGKTRSGRLGNAARMGGSDRVLVST